MPKQREAELFVGSIENIYITVIDYQWSAICGKDNFDGIILFMNNIIFMIAFTDLA